MIKMDKILMIEDNPDGVTNFIKQVKEHQGYELTIRLNLIRARREILEDMPDVILLDLNMGDYITPKEMVATLSKEQMRHSIDNNRAGLALIPWLVNYTNENNLELPKVILISHHRKVELFSQYYLEHWGEDLVYINKEELDIEALSNNQQLHE